MSRLPLTGIAATSVVGFFAISASSQVSGAGTEATQTAVIEEVTMAGGEALYLKHCRFCHGTKGTSGKRLAGNEKMADADYVAHVILVGPGYMTPFAEHLTDEEIANITTYIRNSWGNAYGQMDSSAVAALR